jgi:hypothetical protein
MIKRHIYFINSQRKAFLFNQIAKALPPFGNRAFEILFNPLSYLKGSEYFTAVTKSLSVNVCK